MTQHDTRGIDPDVEPSGPQDLRRETWRYIMKRTTREFGFDDLPDAAAALTYYGVLSIFPALIAVVAGFVVFGDGDGSITSVLGILKDAFPGTDLGEIEDALAQLADSSGWFALVFGVVLTIWTVSRYVGAFSRAMNRIYEVDEGRGFTILKPQQLLISVVFAVLLGVMGCMLIVSGPVADAVGTALGIGEPWLGLWSILKWPILVLLAIVVIGLLYYSTPNVHQRRFRWLSMGALLALTTMVVSSALFFIYILNFSNYGRIYGSLAGALIFFIWLWIANLALLFGAEFDSEVERGRQLQSGIAAEENLRMPPRTTALAEKRAARAEADVAEGRGIRYDSAPRAPKGVDPRD
ncbi:YihY/virulence factor BrkB family protein [Leifsonia sp. Leaf264]|uniref:YihY/virulence factor BrkB family protein n=1 Tax=Leifsonia sp. Leaf264 TaxID=1736314 RepID=UPI0006FD170C|nr:YihY/virulence factor BrkB family protein [Leifsonia sp. Leaf264]KQO99860.1 ribonuclease BN [Leifsonia sp. Leaf264]